MKVLQKEFFTFKEYINREGFVGLKTKEGVTLNSLMNIRYLLNILVMARFRLNPYPAVEGGMYGKNVKLVNSHTMTLGLEKEISFGRRPSIEEKQILSWYSELLNMVFITGNDDYPNPDIIWFDKSYEDELPAKFSLLRSAVVASSWKGKDDSYKANFFDITFINKIAEVTKNSLLEGDYLVPLKERGTLKEKKNTTFLVRTA